MAEIEAGAGAATGAAGNRVANETAQSRRARRQALPKYRNLGLADITPGIGYRLAPPGVVSILHRVSGILMFLIGIPFMLYLLQNSLTSELSFQAYKAAVGSWLGKLVLLVLLWSFFHHLVAGIRFLVLDLHIGTEREQASRSARFVVGVSLLLTVITAVALSYV